MKPLPTFDLHYPDGLALVDLTDHIDVESLGTSERYQKLIQKLMRAAADIELLKEGWRPDAGILDQAPLLSYWSFAGGSVPGHAILAGIVTGHPKIINGGFCTTSVLLAIDANRWSWARTASRFYRLEAPAEAPAQETPQSLNEVQR